MPTVAEALRDAETRLAQASDSPRLDAELLLAHALGVTRGQLLARRNDTSDSATFDRFLTRRLAGEPIAYILGTWEFYSIELAVEAPTLVPRPETEHLVEAVLKFTGNHPARVLDLCTGTGCVAIAIATNAPGAAVTAVDINPAAVALARRNASRLGLTDRVRAIEGDLYAALSKGEPAFDVICANPPYVAEREWAGLSETIRKFEDPGALVSGPEGLDCIRRIVAEAPGHLRPGGLLALEMGQGQAAAVGTLLEKAGFVQVATRKDLGGIERIASGIWPD
jgi:release factor glutamine methyltransferase